MMLRLLIVAAMVVALQLNWSIAFVKTPRAVLRRSSTAIGALRDILALDFDGVICASSGESSVSSLRAARREWPSHCNFPDDGSTFDGIRRIVSNVRPVIETGFENMLVVRYICDKLGDDLSEAMDEDRIDLTVASLTDDIFDQWCPMFRDDLLQQFKSTSEHLINSFGSMRDEMISTDFEYWVGLNEVYDPVRCALLPLSSTMTATAAEFSTENSSNANGIFIITTKQGRFVRAILESNGLYLIRDGVSNSVEDVETTGELRQRSNVFDLDNAYGSKRNVLQELTRRLLINDGAAAGVLPTIHFVEDRYETLLSIVNFRKEQREATGRDELKHVQLYLVDWGYNTESQRKWARQHPEIALIGFKDFERLVDACTKD